jgi:hypothetical protein
MKIPVRRREPVPAITRGATEETVTCDAACPAAAQYRVFVHNGILTFCNHHFQRFVMTFLQRGYKWVRLGEWSST